jgi:hypothetical protein
MTKYKAVPVIIDGIRFASRKEGKRYADLKILEIGGRIANLELQPEYPVVINGVKVCTYKADFRYFDPHVVGPNGQKGGVVVEDVKGIKTPIYRIKKKMVEAAYPGVIISET